MPKHKRDPQTSCLGRNGQAALDFLFSWGWVIAIIIIVVGVLFELGIFSIPTSQTIISGFSGVKVSEASANNTLLVVKVSNNFGSAVTLNGITASVNGHNYSGLDCQSVQLEAGAASLCRLSISIPSGGYTLSMSIKYRPVNSNEIFGSNGTVSGTSGVNSIPLNDEKIFFNENSLPVGTIWSVTVGSTTNQTTVPSSGKQLLSFTLPFGTYSYTIGVPSVSGCSGVHGSPSSGSVTTGSTLLVYFTASCTTTFSETGVPSGYSWGVTYENKTGSATAGNGVSISVPLSPYSYPANSSVAGLACISSNSLQVGSGSSASFKSWNCTTTFNENGLPSSQTWHTNYGGSDTVSASTGSPISLMQPYISAISPYSAAAYSDQLACNSNGQSILQGSSAANLGTWTCTTTFNNGVPSAYDSYTWEVTYTGTQSSSNPVTSSVSVTTSGITTVSSQQVTQGTINGLACSYTSTGETYLEGSTNNVFSDNYWTCTTTFSENGLPGSTNWGVIYNGNQAVSASSISFQNTPASYAVNIPGSLYTSSRAQYTQSNSPTFALAGTSVPTIEFSTNGVTPPSNIIMYVPVTITNNQGVATGSNFQQRILINNPYFDTNLQNVEFFTASGNILNSWLELSNVNNHNAVYWVSIPNINAGSSETIYAGITAHNINFFNGNTVGEAPQLSSSYAQYDNGGKVFNVYINGNTNPNSFSTISYVSSTGGSAVNCPVKTSTGIPYQGSGSGTVTALYTQGGCLVYSPDGDVVVTYDGKSLPKGAVVIESNFNISNALGSDNGVAGLTNYSSIPIQNLSCPIGSTCDSTPPLWAIGTQSGGVNVAQCSSTTCYMEYQDYAAGVYTQSYCFYPASSTVLTCLGTQEGIYSPGNNRQGVANRSWNYAELTYTGSSTYTSYVGGLPYSVDSNTGYSSSVNTNFAFSGSSLYLSLLSEVGSGQYSNLAGGQYAYKTYFNWMFARDYPPNGVMPSVTFGPTTLVGAFASVSGNNQQASYEFMWSGGSANTYGSGGTPGFAELTLYNASGNDYYSYGTDFLSLCQEYGYKGVSLSDQIYNITVNSGSGGACSNTFSSGVTLPAFTGLQAV